MKLIPIGPQHLLELWPLIEPHAVRLSERYPENWTPHELVRQVRDREILLFVACDGQDVLAFLATQVRELPTGLRVFLVKGVGGRELHRWFTTARVEIERHAKAMGCTRIAIENAREGWARLIPGARVERRLTLSKDI